MDFKNIANKIQLFESTINESTKYYLCNKLSEEVGEVSQIINHQFPLHVFKKHMKKVNDKEFKDKLGEELSDVFIITTLISKYFEIDLEKEILKKLNILI